MLIPLCIGSVLAEAGIFIASRRNRVLVVCHRRDEAELDLQSNDIAFAEAVVQAD
jgi:hypothetical protein